MEITSNLLPGYRVYDYLLLLNPHEELRNRIIGIKKAFNEEYHIKAHDSKPNVPIASFTQYEFMEERIKNRLRQVALGFPAVKIELSNFGSFPSHTIYIAVTTKAPLQKLVREVRTEAQRLMKPDAEHKPYFHMEPYIKIATKLKPWQYEKGWLDYSQRHFTGRFIADHMVLVKRMQGEQAWQVAERFDFKNLPVQTKQGELFG